MVVLYSPTSFCPLLSNHDVTNTPHMRNYKSHIVHDAYTKKNKLRWTWCLWRNNILQDVCGFEADSLNNFFPCPSLHLLHFGRFSIASYKKNYSLWSVDGYEMKHKMKHNNWFNDNEKTGVYWKEHSEVTLSFEDNTMVLKIKQSGFLHSLASSHQYYQQSL